MEKKLIVITGGSGFLMSNFIKDYGHKYDIVAPRSSEVNLVSGHGMKKLPARPDAVIHSAAVYGGLVFNQKYPEKILLDNLRITANISEYIFKSNPRKTVIIGSACAYPNITQGVLTEEMIGAGRMEKTVEIYAMNKMHLLSMVERCLNNWSYLILANMYGPGDHINVDKSHVVSAITQKLLLAQREKRDVQLLGTGDVYRSIVYVKDVCDVIDISINDINNVVLNVGHETGLKINEIANIIAEEIDFKYKILWGNKNDNGASMKVLNYSKIDNIYPNRMKTDFKIGIKKTISEYILNNQ